MLAGTFFVPFVSAVTFEYYTSAKSPFYISFVDSGTDRANLFTYEHLDFFSPGTFDDTFIYYVEDLTISQSYEFIQSFCPNVKREDNFDYGLILVAPIGFQWQIGHTYKFTYSSQVVEYISSIWHWYFTIPGASFTAVCSEYSVDIPVSFVFQPVVDLSFISLDCETDILRLSVAANGAVSALYPSDVDGQGVSGVYDNLTGFFDVFLPSGLSSGLHNLYYYGALEHEGEFFAFDGVYSFDYTCSGSPPPEESPPEAGQFKIVYPVSKQVFDNGTGSIVVQVQYGGDASVDFPGYGVKLKLENLAGTEWSSYLVSPVVSDGITTWSVSMPINDDNSYTLNAYLQSSDTWLASVVRFDFVFFEVGGGSIPEDVVGFLQRWWEMFKEWFVGVMNYLFVPTAQQISSLLPSSASSDYGFNPFTPEMFPSPIYALDIPLSATHSVSLSIQGVPDLYVTIMRAFSQVFISLSLIFFILKGF